MGGVRVVDGGRPAGAAVHGRPRGDEVRAGRGAAGPVGAAAADHLRGALRRRSPGAGAQWQGGVLEPSILFSDTYLHVFYCAAPSAQLRCACCKCMDLRVGPYAASHGVTPEALTQMCAGCRAGRRRGVGRRRRRCRGRRWSASPRSWAAWTASPCRCVVPSPAIPAEPLLAIAVHRLGDEARAGIVDCLHP